MRDASISEHIGRYSKLHQARPASFSKCRAIRAHLSDHDLERYHLGRVTDEAELARLEEHYLGCPECAKRAEESAGDVDAIRAGIITGDFDLE